MEDRVQHPIAVFDSGLGGLSVVRHLRELLPHEDLVYFGDTARVPYGTKSRVTIVQFARDDANFLMEFEPKIVVVACNTASALALSELAAELPVPVLGVVEPGAATAVALAAGRPIGVLGTEATVGSGAYPAAIKARAPRTEVVLQACPLFVPLVEEGRESSDPVVRLVCEGYLAPLRSCGVGVVLLGCTHYPLLRDAIAATLGPDVQIVDSGAETSRAVRAVLTDGHALHSGSSPSQLHCFVSDHPERFRTVGSRFLECAIEHVEYVAPERYIASIAHEPLR